VAKILLETVGEHHRAGAAGLADAMRAFVGSLVRSGERKPDTKEQKFGGERAIVEDVHPVSAKAQVFAQFGIGGEHSRLPT
jgi:hypothetical protein